MQGLSCKSFLVILSYLQLFWGLGCSQETSNPPDASSPHTVLEQQKSPIVVSPQTLQACKLCHSNREMQRGPVIDGMEEWYLFEQLQKFKSGQRGKQDNNRAEFLMGTAMKDISADPGTLRPLAAAFANLPPQPALTTIKGDIERGKQLYQPCASCHGLDAKGRREVKAPGLLIQEDWFLLDQLRKYKLGLRGTQPGDTFGLIMANSVKTWPDQDFKDVVTYLNSLSSKDK